MAKSSTISGAGDQTSNQLSDVRRNKKAKLRLYSELFPKDLSKSDKRRLEILDGAVKAYAAVSYEHVSFDDVAGPARTSRRLVKHYFPDKNDLFETTMKMIRGQYQVSVIAALEKADTPEQQFVVYVKSAVSWAHTQPLHARAWFSLFSCLFAAEKNSERSTKYSLTPAPLAL